jgi:hypothetical protein
MQNTHSEKIEQLNNINKSKAIIPELTLGNRGLSINFLVERKNKFG